MVPLGVCHVCSERKAEFASPPQGGICGPCRRARCRKAFLRAMHAQDAPQPGEVFAIVHIEGLASVALYAEVLEYLRRYCKEPQTWVYVLVEYRANGADSEGEAEGEERALPPALADGIAAPYSDVLARYTSFRESEERANRGPRGWKVADNPEGEKDRPQVRAFPVFSTPHVTGRGGREYFPRLRRMLERSLRGELGAPAVALLDAADADSISERVLKACLLGSLDLGARCAAPVLTLRGDVILPPRAPGPSTKKRAASGGRPPGAASLFRPFRSLRKADVEFLLQSFVAESQTSELPGVASGALLPELPTGAADACPGEEEDVLTAEIRKIDYSPESVLAACSRISFGGPRACPVCGSVLQQGPAGEGRGEGACPCAAL